MKPYGFNEKEYTDLNSLGIDFAGNLDLALEAIQQKAFLKFIKKFKVYKKQIIQILYETRYLQNALSFIIYTMTEPHILVIGSKQYTSFETVYKDLKTNDAMEAFIRERGFSKTILSTIEDEKLRMNLIALENNFSEEFAVDFIYNYLEYDEIDSLESYIKPILLEEKEPFKKALRLFKNREFLFHLGHKFYLKDILEIKQRGTPVFAGVKLLISELPLETIEKIIQPEFCLNLLDNLKQYKFKSADAKLLRYKLKKYRKITLKKKEKFKDITQKIDFYEKIFAGYLEFVDLFKRTEIVLKKRDSGYDPMFPYCDTYVWEQYTLDNSIELDRSAKEYVPLEHQEYDLKKLYKSIRNHKWFIVWMMIFTILTVLYYPVVILLNLLQKNDSVQVPEETLLSLDFTHIVNLIFIGSAAGAFLIALLIFGIRLNAKSKYNGLCRLKYYRNNESILIANQQKDYEYLKERESKYSKSIDRFYRFYGSVGMFALAVAVSSMATLFCYDFGSKLLAELQLGAETLIARMLYFLFIPGSAIAVLGLLRHKKTSWSSIFTFLFSLLASICLIYFVSRV